MNSRIRRRRGSATALKGSETVDARGMLFLIYSYMGICQAALFWDDDALTVPRHNADSKWGATFYYWNPYTLPSYSAPPTQKPWGPGSQAWWDEIVRRASYAGFGWLAANSWGDNSNADPATLGGLVKAITNSGTNMKVALFDDTTSEVLRKNSAKHGCWALPDSGSSCAPDSTLRFDLSDANGSGEGGWFYFYDHQWKRFFETVPDSMRFKIDGRPVLFMWLSGHWYSNPSSFDRMLGALKKATNADFGFTPYVIDTAEWGSRYLDITREYTLAAASVTPSIPGGGVMFSGNTLFPDLEAKRSSSGFFCLYYQGDGNLVLYQNSSSALWSTGATGGKAGCATMQSDGN